MALGGAYAGSYNFRIEWVEVSGTRILFCVYFLILFHHLSVVVLCLSLVLSVLILTNHDSKQT